MGTKIEVHLIQVRKMAIIPHIAPDEDADYTYVDTVVTVLSSFLYTSPIQRRGHDHYIYMKINDDIYCCQ